FLVIVRRHPTSTLFPYTTLFRSEEADLLFLFAGLVFRRLGFSSEHAAYSSGRRRSGVSKSTRACSHQMRTAQPAKTTLFAGCNRSEEHTSELQSLRHLVCRLLLE